MAFIKGQFEASFEKALAAIAGAERVTKEQLRDVSRTVLEAWHITGNVEYANKLIGVLTPVNRKVAVAFFTHFSGFSYNETLARFSGKSKKRYAEAHKLCMEFLEDPLNNIWTWADRNIEIKQKDFDIEAVTKYITHALKKAQGVGLSQTDVLKAVFKGGVEPDAVLAVFDEMGLEFGEVAE